MKKLIPLLLSQGCDTVLHDRLYQSLGGVGNGRQPQFPFSRIDVLPPQAPATIPAPAAGLAFQEQPHPAMGDVPSGVADVAPSPATRNPYAYPHTSRVDATTPMGGVSGVSAVGGIAIFNPSAGPQQQPTYLPPSPTIYGQVLGGETFLLSHDSSSACLSFLDRRVCLDIVDLFCRSLPQACTPLPSHR